MSEILVLASSIPLYHIDEIDGALLALHRVKCTNCQYKGTGYVNLMYMDEEAYLANAPCLQCNADSVLQVTAYIKDYESEM